MKLLWNDNITKYMPLLILVSIIIYYLFCTNKSIYKVRRNGFTNNGKIGTGQLSADIQNSVIPSPSASQNCYTTCSIVPKDKCNTACINNTLVGCVWNDNPGQDYLGATLPPSCQTKF